MLRCSQRPTVFSQPSLTWFIALAVATLMLTACGDDEESATDTAQGDTAAGDTHTDTAVSDIATTDVADATEPPTDVASDAPEVFTGLAQFSLYYTHRDIFYMVGAGFVTIPDIQVRAQDLLTRDSLPGQEIAFDFPYTGSRSDPSTSVTDAEGLTGPVRFMLTGDMSRTTADLGITPYIVGTEPAPQSTRTLPCQGITVTVHLPEDVDGTQLPIVGDGTSTVPVTITLAKNDTRPFDGDVTLSFEVVQSGGTSPLAFADTAELSKTWTVDPTGSDISFDLVSTAAGASQFIYLLTLRQADTNRGTRTTIVPVLAP